MSPEANDLQALVAAKAEADRKQAELAEKIAKLNAEKGEEVRKQIKDEYASKFAALRAEQAAKLKALGIGRGGSGERHRCPISLKQITKEGDKVHFVVKNRDTGEVLEKCSVAANAPAINEITRKIIEKYKKTVPGDWGGNARGGWVNNLKEVGGVIKPRAKSKSKK